MGAAAVVAAVWGCNAILGLDDVDRPVPGDDGGGGADADGASQDEAATPSGACTVDTDCAPLDPCLTPRCETSTRRCLYPTCEPTACRRSVCNAGPPRACTQTSEPYNTVAADLGLPGVSFGCSSNATDCFAAVYPFAFVGAASGVVALPISDLKQLEPARVPVDLPFAVAQIVASGDVVYFLGPVRDGKISLAALRVPTDPRVAKLSPVVAEPTYPFPSARLYPGTGGSALLVFDDAATGYPTATLEPTLGGAKPIVHVPAPLDDAGAASSVDPGAAKGMYGAFGLRVGDPDAAVTDRVAASSNDRLLIVQPVAPPRYAVVFRPGTPRAAIGGAQTAISPYVQQYIEPISYATGPEGTVVSVGMLRSPLDGARFRTAVVVSWILGPALTRLEGADYLAMHENFYEYDAGAIYPTPIPLPARLLPMDGENLFIVTTPKSTSPSGLSVIAVHRNLNSAGPLYAGKLVVFDDPAGDMAPGTVAVAKAAELALVLRKTPTGAKMLVLDSRCAPK